MPAFFLMATGVRVRRECEWIRRLLGKGGKKRFYLWRKDSYQREIFKRIDSILKIFENVYSLKRINETLMYD